MKRHLIATFVIAALSPAAVQAGSISFDMRADLEMTEYNPAAGRVGGTSTANNTTHRRDNYRMTFPSLRLDAKGNFSDTTSTIVCTSDFSRISDSSYHTAFYYNNNFI